MAAAPLHDSFPSINTERAFSPGRGLQHASDSAAKDPSVTCLPINSDAITDTDDDDPLLGPPVSLPAGQRSLMTRMYTAVFGWSRLRRKVHRNRRNGRTRSEPRLTHLDRMTLSPFTKYQRFGRVPVKFLLALGVVASLTAFYVVKNMQAADYVDGTTDVLRFVLGNDPDAGAGLTPAGGTVLYAADDLRTHMQSAVLGYFSFPNTSVTYYRADPSVRLQWTNTSGDYEIMLTPDAPLGPLTHRTGHVLSQWLQQHSSLSLHFYLISHQYKMKDHNTLMDARYGWRCRGDYRLGDNGGRAEYTLRITSILLSSSRSYILVLNSLVVGFAFPSFVLTLIALYKSLAAYRYAKKHLSRPPKTPTELVWSRLNFQDKLAFFNLWHVSSSIGDLMLVIGSALTFTRELGFREDSHESLSLSDILHALGGFLAWVSLLKFCEWSAELYMLILAVKASLGRVARFIFTVSPVYFAYAFAGVACFYDHPDLFGNIFKTSRTMFSLINGDSILLIFQELEMNGNVGYVLLAHVYVYSLGTIFIVTIMNVFVFVIESGYDAALTAVYGKDDELQVHIDHERLHCILSAAQANDPRGEGVTLLNDGVLDDTSWFPLPRRDASPYAWRQRHHRRRSRGDRSSSEESDSRLYHHRARAMTDTVLSAPQTLPFGGQPRGRSTATVVAGVATTAQAESGGVNTEGVTAPHAQPGQTNAERRALLLKEIQTLQTTLNERLTRLATLG